jgi:hypothetical protein
VTLSERFGCKFTCWAVRHNIMYSMKWWTVNCELNEMQIFQGGGCRVLKNSVGCTITIGSHWHLQWLLASPNLQGRSMYGHDITYDFRWSKKNSVSMTALLMQKSDDRLPAWSHTRTWEIYLIRVQNPNQLRDCARRASQFDLQLTRDRIVKF